jgi:hypothetical protein
VICKSLIASVLVVALAGFSLSATLAAPPATPDAAAKDWLLFIDGGDYAKGWYRAGVPFKAQITAAVLQSSIAPAREPLGAILQRMLFNVTLSNTAPGLPEGRYAVVRFSSRFANRAEAGETVWLDFEDNHWLVIGYIIAPAAPKAVQPPATGQAAATPDAKNCDHEELVEARIARMNGYTGGPNCANGQWMDGP